MPKIRGKQINADTLPVNPNDVVNKAYADGLVISGGTGAISIQDEGVLVSSGATVLNFIGTSVLAQQGIGRVDIFIPAPTYSSHFNTSDGTTDAVLTSISTTNRYISNPTTEGNPFKIGSWVAGSTHPTIRNSVSPSYSTPQTFSIFNSATTLRTRLYDADGTSVLAENLITLNADGVFSTGGIMYTVTGWSPDADRFKATVSISIQIPTGGRRSIEIIHDNGADGTYTFTQNNIFKDSETLNANLDTSVLTIAEGTSVVTKHISGVEFYTLNTQWHVHVTDVNNLNSISFPITQQMVLSESNLFISTDLNIHGLGGSYDTFSGTTWTNLHSNTGATYDKLNWVTNQTNQTNWNNGTGSLNSNTIIASVYDWGLSDTATSSGYNYLIDTLVDGSDRNSEMFRSETTVGYPRLQSDLTTSWDSTISLLSQDSGNGLQLLGDRLVYPKYNFTAYNPNMSSQPNYIAASGDKYYYRRFDTNGANVSNGIIVFSDHNLVESDLSGGTIRFDISIDNGSSWFSLNSQYIGGVLSNGSGCRIDVTEFGLGVGTTNNSALRFSLGLGGTSTFIYLRIIYNSSAINKYIGGIDITDANWI
jgi:hypothetical protein